LAERHLQTLMALARSGLASVELPAKLVKWAA